MKKYFLIDTNIWVSVLREDKKDYLLNCLQQLTSENKITLLVPNILAQEWNSEKSKQIDQLKKTHSTAIDVITHTGSQIIKPQLHNEIGLAKKKVEKIDYLLKNGEHIKISNKVKSNTIDRASQRKAPFHNSGMSLNDSLLYFSVIEYLKKQNLSELVFITKNVKDFGMPGNQNEELHSDLIIDGIKTWYFTDLGRSFIHFKNELSLPTKDSFSESTKDYRIVLIEPQSYNILEHLHITLTKATEQLEFIPTNILARMTPIRNRNKANEYSYYSNFCLHINNKELFQFFDDLEIGKTVKFKKVSHYKNSKENIKKATEVIRILNFNHILSIANTATHEKIDIHRKVSEHCDCVRCCFQRLELSKALVLAETDPQNIQDKIKSAFVLYLFGFYDKSIKKFYQIYLDAKTRGLNIIAFRAAHNLLWMRTYSTFYQDPEMNKIGAEINEIDLTKEYYSFINASEYEQEIAFFYYTNNFHYHYSDDISEDASKVRKHFESQLSGGYSNNNNYWNLISHYSEFESFIKHNCLTYSKFSNFKRVFNKYNESVFLSLVLNEYQDSRLMQFSDYNLIHLVFYEEPKEITKYYNRHFGRLIKYIPDHPKSKFEELAYNYFLDSESFQKLYKTKSEDWNDFGQTYENIFLNILVLISITDFDENFLTKINKLIFSFLESNKLKQFNVEYVGYFIKRIRPLLNNDELYSYFELFIKQEKFHHNDLFYSFNSKGIIKNKRFVINRKNDFESVLQTFFEKCPKCKNFHSTSLFSIYFLLSPKYKNQLKIKIERKLANDFDLDLYYNAAMREIIDYKKLFKVYLEMFSPPKEKPRKNPFFSNGEIVYHRFNELFNLVFKYNISLSKKFVTEYKGMSDYYDWLLDMRAFDYSKFNPLWIIQYPTSIYLEKIFKQQNVKKKVKEYLKKNYQPTLSKYYASYV